MDTFWRSILRQVSRPPASAATDEWTCLPSGRKRIETSTPSLHRPLLFVTWQLLDPGSAIPLALMLQRHLGTSAATTFEQANCYGHSSPFPARENLATTRGYRVHRRLRAVLVHGLRSVLTKT